MPVCRICKKTFMSDKSSKVFCGEPCKSPSSEHKTYAEKWLARKPNKPQKKRLSSVYTQRDG